MHLDHVNGNRKDNRIANLRKATRAQNSSNSKLPHNNTSGFKGVAWHKTNQKWQGYVGFANKRHHVGFFDTPEEADVAVREARETLHGAFARHQ